MKSSHNSYWNINIVQVIALLYKDQHVGNLQKLLNHWIESSALSDTSEDNESNTSPQRPCCNLSPMMTSNDPTSDSSDNGIGRMTEMSTSQLLLDSGIQLNSRNKGKMCSNDESFDSMLWSTNSDNSEYFNQDISMKVGETWKIDKIVYITPSSVGILILLFEFLVFFYLFSEI